MEKESDYLLSNQEILGGLNSAINRGESLKDAMMTFYQAGYDKVEIEETARALLNQQRNMSAVGDSKQKNTPEDKRAPAQPIAKETKTLAAQSTTKEIKPQPSPAPAKGAGTVPKHVSSYGVKKAVPEKPKSNVVTVILIFALLVLLGVLAAVFLFKEDLVNFVNGLLV